MKKALLALILGAAGAPAETIWFTGLPLNTAYGTYNGFAHATVNGVPAQLLICDDYDHTTYFPSGPLTYSVSTLAGTNPLEFARFTNPLEWEQSIARYQQAALLLDGLLHTGPGYLLDLTADYQYALWHLFTPTVALPTQTAQTLLDHTAAALASPDVNNLNLYARLRIYTPTQQFASNQEFLALGDEPLPWSNTGPPLFEPLAPPQAQAVPEPSGWVLMSIGVGLLIAASAPRRALLLRHLSALRGPKTES